MEEDKALTAVVDQWGAKGWTKIAVNFPGRIGKQCRERWHNHLCPNIVKRKWTLQEDLLIVKLYMKFKTRWCEIARRVPGRSDNQIKNRYNSNLKKRFEDMEFADLTMNDIDVEKIAAELE